MDLDNIKDLWQKAAVATPEISLEKQKEIRMPLEKIRKNMRMEFWATVICVIFLILLGFMLSTFISSEKFAMYYTVFLLSFLMIIIFYFVKFFRLYKDLENMDFNTKESLKDLVWKFKLNEQYYLSYYIATVPVILFELAIFMDYVPGYKEFTGIKFYYTYILGFILSLGMLYYIGKYWFRKYYGVYIYKITKTLKVIEIQESAVR